MWKNEKVVGVKLFKFIIGYYYSVEGELFYFLYFREFKILEFYIKRFKGVINDS